MYAARVLGTFAVAALAACGQPTTNPSDTAHSAPPAAAASGTERCDNFAEHGQALFGDVHVHTSYSFDAAANSTGATPADAHRYARGESIPFFPLDDQGNPVGTAQIDRPLDFLAVTDHGEFLGERALCSTPGSPVYDNEFCAAFRADQRQGMMLLASTITTETPSRIPAICGADGKQCPEWAKGPWQDIQDAANDAYAPCSFTSFIGYEYTGTPGTSNYHRNVIFRNSSVPAAPVSYVDAPIDSKLWAGLDAVCLAEQGCDYLTIPHNTNLANGLMAPYRKLPDTLEAKQGYAQKRLQREPIMEIFQHKGSSECINGLTSVLGAPDELCGVEAVRRIGERKGYLERSADGSGGLVTRQAFKTTAECPQGATGEDGMLGAGCVHPTDFQRSALLVGLAEEQTTGYNPIKLGVIASTDTHSANPGGVAEDNWGGAVTGESSPAERLMPGLLTSGIDGNPGGLAGVWAQENTRDAIFDATLRREVFGTSGPRIVPRLFAGWDFASNLCERTDRDAAAYASGVPMGGDLEPASGASPTGTGNTPSFMVHAAQDPRGNPLQALHLIKGWVAADGSLHTEVIEAASADSGAATLCAVYTDADFDSKQSAYYYLRAVEIPSPRWHTYDCAQIPEAERPAVCSNGAYPDTVQEMAWTSPIWYRAASIDLNTE